MLKIALCDDDHHSIERYAALISQIAGKHQMKVEFSSYHSGEALLFHYTDIPDEIDIIYLDILMNGTNGMQTARRLRDCGCKAQIVFLTSCEDYVYDAFDVDAIQYLLKEDTSPNKFESTFLKAAELAAQKEEEIFTFESGGKVNLIPIHQIAYFEIWKRVITVHYGAGKTAAFYDSMEQLERKLRGKGFVRAHRSYLVYLPYISMFRQQSLQLKTGEIIPVGITYLQPLKKRFSDYILRFQVYKPPYAQEREN